jgi:hypothetical protein|nr:MAG TPA: hypothetical protein [Caudoviricetes sp.]
MKDTEHNKCLASRLYYKAESVLADFQSNHSIDPQGWYDGTSMEREDALFFFPVVSADFDWSDAEAREEAMSDMDYVISVSHDTILDTVQEWYAQADSDGLGRFVVNELVAEYLPQMLARESALCEYRGKMIDILAEAARTRWDR